MKVDISPFFWQFVESILTYNYDTLKETDMYMYILDCVENEYVFCIEVHGVLFEYQNIDDLFYGLLNSYEETDKQIYFLLQKAIEKMEMVIKTNENMDDIEDSFLKGFHL